MCGDGGGEVCDDAFGYRYPQSISTPGSAVSGSPANNEFGGISGGYYDDSGECPY